MSVIRVNKTKDFTVMSNHHFRDKRLSLKAKGLLSEMLSLPEDWDYTVAGLVFINKESKSSIQSTLKELEETGYLARTRTQNELGQFDYIYDIYEKPSHGEPQTENQFTDNPCTENQPQYNTKVENTDDKVLKNKVSKIERTKCPRFVRPTVEEVQAYCQERGNSVNAERFVDFYTANGWKVGKNPMKDWKASVRTWEQRDSVNKPKQKAPSNYDLSWLDAE